MKAFFARATRRKWIVFVVVAVVCTGLVTLLLLSEPAGRSVPETLDARKEGMPVSVGRIVPATHAAVITALGEATPLWQTTVKSQVAGPVIYLNPRLQPGNQVAKDEVLVRIEPKSYRRQLAEANGRLARAEVALLKEQREVREARRNWKQSGLSGTPRSALVLRKPQLAAARAEVEAARADLAHAENELSYTEIRAPFDAVVVSRTINPGESLFVGDAVTTLYGLESAEVRVQLDPDQWRLLDAIDGETTARLVAPQQQATWNARVVRDGQRLDSQSRLRSVYLRVDRPLEQDPPLLPGTFVRAEIMGRPLADLLCLPETALTKQGLVWFVGEDKRLVSRPVVPLFYEKGRIFVRRPADLEGPVQVALAPNDSFINGLAVSPLFRKERG